MTCRIEHWAISKPHRLVRQSTIERKAMMSAAVFVGHDWAEDHHDIHIEDMDGMRLHACRLDDGVEG